MHGLYIDCVAIDKHSLPRDTRQWGCETLRQSERFGGRKHGEDYIRLRDSVVIAPDHIRHLGPTDSCNASAGQRSQHSRTMFAEATTHGGAHLARRYHGNR